MSGGVAIRLVGCAKTFADGTRALEPLDLAVGRGETVVFLGPSGCGKTTTLRLIAGLERPDPGGRVLFDGEDVTAVPIERRQVGMVFQSYALFPNMTVAGNIAYGLKLRKLPGPERERRVAEMLAMMHIEALAERRIDQLSGGQKQRVALARALAIQPRVLLLDEPLTALDAKLRDELRLEIDALLRRLDITAIYVTHDQAEAMALGDRIVVMDHGRVAQAGTPREIYLAPANRFVAEFIGTMNRLKGEVVDGHIELRGGRLPWAGAGAAGLGRGERAAVELLCRPERLRVVGPGEGQLSGVVSAAFFLGDRVRLVLAEAAEGPLIVETGHGRDYAVGERVHLAVDPAGLLLLNT
ncbi:MAG TPA: ABC transporter ATP-binding protein [Alphaproteobacteria bacterium]|nr:ABC transporter ATP-binding protein [Alphaproteobacteria bacterium]